MDAAALFKSWADMALCGNADGLNNSFAASVYSQDFFQKYKAQILSSLQGVGSEQLRRFAILSKAFADFDAMDLIPKIKCPIFAETPTATKFLVLPPALKSQKPPPAISLSTRVLATGVAMKPPTIQKEFTIFL